MFKLIIKTESSTYNGTREITCSSPEAARRQEALERKLARQDKMLRGATITYQVTGDWGA